MEQPEAIAEPPPTRGSRRWRRLARGCLIAAAALVGLYLGLTIAGRANVSVGPLETTMWLEPSLVGDSVVDVPPLGSVRVNSHDGPLRLRVAIRSIDVSQARAIFADPTVLDGLEGRIADDVRSGVISLAVRGLLAGAAAAAAMALLASRSWRRGLLTGGVALSVLLASSLVAVTTFERRALLEPRFTGLLEGAPALFGDAETIAANFESYREGLASLVSRVSRLYDVTSTLPVYEPEEDVTRVLHISDLHLNPTVWPIIRSVVDQFDVDVVVDTGDIVHQGSSVENAYVGDISSVGAPYVYVRGNHDSAATARAVAAEPNAVVLDDEAVTVAGLTFYGVEDPRFTPDKTQADLEADEVAEVGAAAARSVPAGVSVDIALMHDPRGARQFDGVAPYILCGHMHARAQSTLPEGSLIFQQGSTGASGPNALRNEEPTPITLSVLYFSSSSGELEAWDDITLGGLGLASAEIERRLVSSLTGEADEEPEPTEGVLPTDAPDSSLGPPL